MCSSPVRHFNGQLLFSAEASPRKTDSKLTIPITTSSPVPPLNGVVKTSSSPSSRKSSSKRKLSNEQPDCNDVKTEKLSTSVKADSIKKQVHEAESPSAKHSKSQKDSIVEKKQQSEASSKNSVRCVDVKRKSELLVEDVTNVKRYCDQNNSVVNGFAENNEKRLVNLVWYDFSASI